MLFRSRFFIREEKAARRLSCGQDASSPELGIDPLDGNPEASCQLSDCQIACDDRPPCLPRPAFEPVFKTNALDCDRQISLVTQQAVHGLCALLQVAAHLLEHLEELGFFGGKAKLQSALRLAGSLKG